MSDTLKKYKYYNYYKRKHFTSDDVAMLEEKKNKKDKSDDLSICDKHEDGA